MTVPFMRAYTERLVRVCHLHGAHAMGGMSAFIPSRRNEEVNRVAIEKIKQDKEREVADGFDGTWVAHPDLVKVAKEIFMKGHEGRCNQKHRLREDVNVKVEELITVNIPGGVITEDGLRTNISVALQYINSWVLVRTKILYKYNSERLLFLCSEDSFSFLKPSATQLLQFPDEHAISFLCPRGGGG